MKKGKWIYMKLLKISDNQVLYRIDLQNNFKSIDEIDKDDILIIFKEVFKTKDENNLSDIADEFNAKIIGNDAHRIIYEKLYSKIKELWDNRKQITENIQSEFNKLEDEYINK